MRNWFGCLTLAVKCLMHEGNRAVLTHLQLSEFSSPQISLQPKLGSGTSCKPEPGVLAKQGGLMGTRKKPEAWPWRSVVIPLGALPPANTNPPSAGTLGVSSHCWRCRHSLRNATTVALGNPFLCHVLSQEDEYKLCITECQSHPWQPAVSLSKD